MTLNKTRLKNFRLYLILDRPTCGTRNLKTLLEKSIEGGVDMVQFRDKRSSSKTMIKEARPLLKIARGHRVPFIINDRLDVAVSLDADGLHVGQEDMEPETAREILGKDKIIGLSCHNEKDIKAALKKDVDYMGLGPIFKTATKPNLKPIGTKILKKTLKNKRVPIFAIGGMREQTLTGLKGLGSFRMACCREICLAEDPEKISERLKKLIGDVSKSDSK